MIYARASFLLAMALLLVGPGTGSAADDPTHHDQAYLLWPDGALLAKGSEDVDRPQLTAHLPASGRGNGTAVIVNPGGGYRILASDHEGLQVARWLNRHGIAAFVLRYRLSPRSYDSRIATPRVQPQRDPRPGFAGCETRAQTRSQPDCR